MTFSRNRNLLALAGSGLINIFSFYLSVFPAKSRFRRKIVETVPGHLFTGGEPHPRHFFHLGNEPVEHGRSQGAAGDKGMNAYAQVFSLFIKLLKNGQPNVEHLVRGFETDT